MFDAEAKFLALERRIEALEKEVKELKKKDKTPVPNSGGGPGEPDEPIGP